MANEYIRIMLPAASLLGKVVKVVSRHTNSMNEKMITMADANGELRHMEDNIEYYQVISENEFFKEQLKGNEFKAQ